MNEIDQAIQRDVFVAIGQQVAEIITLRHKLAAAQAEIAELKELVDARDDIARFRKAAE